MHTTSRYIAKIMYLEKPKCIVIWDGGVVFDTRYQLLQVRTCKWPWSSTIPYRGSWIGTSQSWEESAQPELVLGATLNSRSKKLTQNQLTSRSRAQKYQYVVKIDKKITQEMARRTIGSMSIISKWAATMMNHTDQSPPFPARAMTWGADLANVEAASPSSMKSRPTRKNMEDIAAATG